MLEQIIPFQQARRETGNPTLCHSVHSHSNKHVHLSTSVKWIARSCKCQAEQRTSSVQIDSCREEWSQPHLNHTQTLLSYVTSSLGE